MAMQMWMATRDKGGWVPCASPGADFSAVAWSDGGTFLSGGAYVRRSTGSHKEYEMSWPLMPRDELRKIEDIAKGLWGAGPVFFLDPFAMDKNVLPSQWAAPMLSANGGTPIVGDIEPTLIAAEANTLDYPVSAGVYNAPLGATQQVLYIPIPTGYTAWFGVHGPVSSTGSLRARGVLPNGTTSALTALTNISVTSTTRMSTSFSGATYKAVELLADRNVTYTGAMGQILPNGVSPTSGGFISGQGNSGCDFESLPRLQAYSSALDKVGMTAKLIEVGSWL